MRHVRLGWELLRNAVCLRLCYLPTPENQEKLTHCELLTGSIVGRFVN